MCCAFAAWQGWQGSFASSLAMFFLAAAAAFASESQTAGSKAEGKGVSAEVPSLKHIRAVLKTKVLESHFFLTTPDSQSVRLGGASWGKQRPSVPRSSESEAGSLGLPWVSVHACHVCPESELQIVVSLWNGAWPAGSTQAPEWKKQTFLL